MSSPESKPAVSLDELENRDALDILCDSMVDTGGKRPDHYFFIPENDELYIAQDALANARINRDPSADTYGHAPISKPLIDTRVHQDIIE